jgi:hypothetical protein
MAGASRIFLIMVGACALLGVRDSARAQNDDGAAAMITSVSCAPGDCTVKRGGGERPARALFVLAAGDVIEAKRGSVEVEMADHDTDTVSGPNGHLTISAPGSADNMLVSGWKSLMRQFSDQSFSDSSASGHSLGGGAHIAQCVRPARSAYLQIVEGARMIAVPIAGWDSGVVPSALDLTDDGGNNVAHTNGQPGPGGGGTMAMPVSARSGAGGTILLTMHVGLVPGRYRLHLKQSGSDVSHATIVVVSKTDAPQMPASLAVGADPASSSALEASWWFAKDNGSWALEALARAEEHNDSALLAALQQACRR